VFHVMRAWMIIAALCCSAADRRHLGSSHPKT
jgi:hypothetical protein